MDMAGYKNYKSDEKSSEDKALDLFAEMMIERIETISKDWSKPWLCSLCTVRKMVIQYLDSALLMAYNVSISLMGNRKAAMISQEFP